jgi:carbamoyltransferase
MHVLGISCYYHDASAALIKDGRVVAASEEERFTRRKHDTAFPTNAIADCLGQAGIGISDVEYVAFYEKPFMKFERILYQHLDGFPWTLKTFLSSMPSWINEKLRVMRAVRKLGFKGDVLFVPHHLAHAASAFYFSPFQKAAILTVDGVGEWSTTTFGVGAGSDIRLIKEIRFPHSLGLLYSTITAYLGFTVNNSEYKVMGLAAYGTMDRSKNTYYGKMRQLIDLKDDGSFRLDMDYFLFHKKDRMPSKKLCELLGGPVREGETGIDERHKDIAAALQLVFEDAMTLMIRHIHKVTGCDHLVMAGGVALNSVYNGKILRETPFKSVWIQPNASDGGTSLGVAAYAYTSILGKKRVGQMNDAYLGPGYSHDEIKAFLRKHRIKHKECRSDRQLIKEVSAMLADNLVIGWFQGRMEWGPRALGARSILSNPCEKSMQEILNLKVKHREKFRPFAPVVCVDDAMTYFECDEPVPEPTDYMLMVYPIRKEFRKQIPAVTHVDGSGRLQTIRREQNRLYYDLIKEFGKITGIPILINTSFNIRGEPIVCTPFDAYKCMMGTGIDCIVMDRFIIRREDNPRDMWDSEKLAKD